MTTRPWLIGLGMLLAVAGLGGTVPGHAANASGEAAAIRQVSRLQNSPLRPNFSPAEVAKKVERVPPLKA